MWYWKNDITPPMNDFALNSMVSHFVLRLSRDDPEDQKKISDIRRMLYPRLDC